VIKGRRRRRQALVSDGALISQKPKIFIFVDYTQQIQYMIHTCQL
jgi:hypothetical protein